jgi:FKBP-type peptidyl-prolyl cis-trans isomerase
LDLELRITELLTPRAARDRAAARIAADPDGYELRLLEPFLDAEQWTSWDDQLYYRIDVPGKDTTVVRTGDMVSLHYQGRFIDGRIFDDTHRNGQPFTFRLGDTGQVIHGIEVAAHLLRKGGRGTFAMRSSMAFGDKGSSTGLVPPFTPVVYEVELIDVQRLPG